MTGKMKKWQRLLMLVCWICLLGFLFAQVEIQIEGPDGWAASLPTWRIEKGWFIDIFWGGRPMTGYHAWVFGFMFLMLHSPVFIFSRWSWRLECRILACIEIFWIVEDFLWFVLNPAYGMDRFTFENVWWHKHWFLSMPLDYWIFSFLAAVLMYISYYGFALPWKHDNNFMETD